MLVVDAQIHIWRNHKPTNPNHRQVTDFTADAVLKEMDAAGVDAAVIHPPGWDPDSNALAMEAARQHPKRLSILGNFPIDRPESRMRRKRSCPVWGGAVGDTGRAVRWPPTLRNIR